MKCHICEGIRNQEERSFSEDEMFCTCTRGLRAYRPKSIHICQECAFKMALALVDWLRRYAGKRIVVISVGESGGDSLSVYDDEGIVNETRFNIGNRTTAFSKFVEAVRSVLNPPDVEKIQVQIDQHEINLETLREMRDKAQREE